MLEVNRRLYLKENTNEKSENYNKTKEIVQGYMNLLRLFFDKLATAKSR